MILPNNSDELESLMRTESDASHDSEVVAQLEKKIEKLEDQINEERFMWILIIILLIDFWLFSGIANWGAAIVIGVFELILMLILVRNLALMRR